MLRLANELKGYALLATDGEIGSVHDLLFDDETWDVRYFVVDTGGWLPGRKVLISPEAFGDAKWVERNIRVGLSKEEIKSSPPVDTDKPLSRQRETEYRSHYAWPRYWAREARPGRVDYGPMTRPAVETEATREQGHVREVRRPDLEEPGTDPMMDDVHLRSLREVSGYHIAAADGEMGRMDDLVIDDEAWTVRYIVVDTGTWLPGKRVLVASAWIEGIDWDEHQVHTDLTRRQIGEAPEFDPSAPINRQYETRLYDFYGRPTYWP
jgi:sporulation protein YlmC with PRC-barrel domain